MPGSIRLGGVRVDFSAQDRQYTQVVNRVRNHNRRLNRSYQRLGRNASSASRLTDQFTSSLQSSLIATAAYAAGVELVRNTVGGSVRAFLEWESGLTRVAKTTGLTRSEVTQLGSNFEELLTQISSLNRPLPVTSQELLRIAEVAGQMRIQGVPNITRFTETVALMGLTTDLVGEQAANALGLIITNTQATVDQVGRIGASITALGNEFRGGEAAIVNIAEDLARSTAEFQLSAQAILAYSAVLGQAGARAEKSGTVFQRSIRALVDATAAFRDGDVERITSVASAAGVAVETLVDAVTSGDYDSALRILIGALSNLQTIGSSTELGRGSLLTLLFGGETPPVRIAEILGVLAKQIGEVDRGLGLSNQSWDEQVALIQEAEREAGTYERRLGTVREQIRAQQRDLGEALTGPFTFIAENFRVIEVAVAGIGTALVANFSRRGIRAFRAYDILVQRGLRQQQVRAAQAATAATRAAAIGPAIGGLPGAGFAAGPSIAASHTEQQPQPQDDRHRRPDC